MVLFWKSHPSSRFYPILSSRNFILLHFIFRPVIHFELIFVKCVWSSCRLIFFIMDVQLFKFTFAQGKENDLIRGRYVLFRKALLWTPFCMYGRPLGSVWKLEEQKRRSNNTLEKSIEPYLWKTSTLVNTLPLGNCWSITEIFILLSWRIIVCPRPCVCYIKKTTFRFLEVIIERGHVLNYMNQQFKNILLWITVYCMSPWYRRSDIPLAHHSWDHSVVVT